MLKSHPSQSTDKEAGCSYGNLERREAIGQGLDLLRATVWSLGRDLVTLSHLELVCSCVCVCVDTRVGERSTRSQDILCLFPLLSDCLPFSCSVWAPCQLSGWCDRSGLSTASTYCAMVYKPGKKDWIASIGCMPNWMKWNSSQGRYKKWPQGNSSIK